MLNISGSADLALFTEGVFIEGNLSARRRLRTGRASAIPFESLPCKGESLATLGADAEQVREGTLRQLGGLSLARGESPQRAAVQVLSGSGLLGAASVGLGIAVARLAVARGMTTGSAYHRSMSS